jgi:hypothetical protein
VEALARVRASNELISEFHILGHSALKSAMSAGARLISIAGGGEPLLRLSQLSSPTATSFRTRRRASVTLSESD